MSKEIPVGIHSKKNNKYRRYITQPTVTQTFSLHNSTELAKPGILGKGGQVPHQILLETEAKTSYYFLLPRISDLPPGITESTK